jgi:hypothetical protein
LLKFCEVPDGTEEAEDAVDMVMVVGMSERKRKRRRRRRR